MESRYSQIRIPVINGHQLQNISVSTTLLHLSFLRCGGDSKVAQEALSDATWSKSTDNRDIPYKNFTHF